MALKRRNFILAVISSVAAAAAAAFSARRHGAEKLSRCGDRFRQQVVRFSLGGMRLVAQPPIGSPVHAARLLRKRHDIEPCTR
jgi:hypothetical protein